MKTVSEELKNHLSQSLTTITKCWKMTLNNGEIMSFTSHNKDINYEEQIYHSLIGFENEAIVSKSDTSFDKTNIISILDSEYISETDLIAGKYDHAEVEIFIINYEDFTMGRVLLFKGFLSDIKCEDGKFFADLKGVGSELERTIGEVFSPLCRANFCGEKCKLLSENFTAIGTVTSITDNTQFYSDSTEIDLKSSGYFDYGLITFTSGKNNGLSTEIKQFDSGNFVLAMEIPYDIEIGDTFSAIAGCNKKFSTCCEFGNAINFRGEPHLPGVDFMLKGY